MYAADRCSPANRRHSSGFLLQNVQHADGDVNKAKPSARVRRLETVSFVSRAVAAAAASSTAVGRAVAQTLAVNIRTKRTSERT